MKRMQGNDDNRNPGTPDSTSSTPDATTSPQDPDLSPCKVAKPDDVHLDMHWEFDENKISHDWMHEDQIRDSFSVEMEQKLPIRKIPINNYQSEARITLPKTPVSSINGAWYNRQEQQEFKDHFMKEVKKPMVGALEIKLQFNFERPSKHYIHRQKGVGHELPNRPKHHTEAPKIDDLIKFVMNALEDTVFNKGTNVVSITATKEWAFEAETIVDIKRLW